MRSLKRSKTKGPPRTEVTGKRFGRLIALNFHHSEPPPSYRSFWLFLCDCGRKKVIRVHHVTHGKTTSCGCLLREKASAMIRIRCTTHGLGNSRVYRSHRAMISRCTEKSDKGFSRYGGRGIKVCPAWHDLLNFYRDMGDPPTPKHTLERIDNNGNYELGNCKWATMKEQSNNRRTNLFITANGKTKTLAQWAELSGIQAGTIRQRFVKGWKNEMLFKEPRNRK